MFCNPARLFHAPKLLQYGAEIVVGLAETWLQRDGAPISGFRLTQPTLVRENVTEIGIGRHDLGRAQGHLGMPPRLRRYGPAREAYCRVWRRHRQFLAAA